MRLRLQAARIVRIAIIAICHFRKRRLVALAVDLLHRNLYLAFPFIIRGSIPERFGSAELACGPRDFLSFRVAFPSRITDESNVKGG